MIDRYFSICYYLYDILFNCVPLASYPKIKETSIKSTVVKQYSCVGESGCLAVLWRERQLFRGLRWLLLPSALFPQLGVFSGFDGVYRVKSNEIDVG